MEHYNPFDTVLMCGVPVLQWQSEPGRTAIAHCGQILQLLTRNGYREIVLDLQKVVFRAPRELQRFLSNLERMLPPHTRAEVVLPAGSQLVRLPKRMRVAPSVTIALSHITRLPAVSLQTVPITHVRWQEDQG